MFISRKYYKALWIAVSALIVASVAAVTLVVVLRSKSAEVGENNNNNKKPDNNYHGGVVTNGYECSKIGGDILLEGGSAVDAAIASLFCEGVAMPQSCGIGGGFMMVIYSKRNRTVETLIARETAPVAAQEDMFGGDSQVSAKGGLSIAIPGELRGYWEAHKKYGVLPWAKLVQPTIDICKSGITVTNFLAGMFKKKEKEIKLNDELSAIFLDSETGGVYEEGKKYRMPKLAKTLELVAEKGPDVLYNGELTEAFVKDVHDSGGVITVEDMKAYRPVWKEPVKTKIADTTLYSVPAPASGPVLIYILNLLNDFLDTTDTNVTSPTNWQRIVESMKHAYGLRTQLGDPDKVDIQAVLEKLTSMEYASKIRDGIWDNVTYSDMRKYGVNATAQLEDHGTAHISVLHPNGDAVSVTSTINLYFGSEVVSPSTGIILNDEMDDFSAPNITNSFGMPPFPNNYISPGKRPVSSMSPAIIVDKNGDPVLVVGAAGGTQITTSVALTILRAQVFGQNLHDAVQSPRIHHQLLPMKVQSEDNFSKYILKKLEEIGHEVYIKDASDGFAAVTALLRTGGNVTGEHDSRRAGRITLVRRNQPST